MGLDANAGHLRDVLKPVGEARGLPNAHYVDPATHARETARVFAPHWAALGFASDVPETGDARPVDFLGQPLLLLRDREGQVRVFLNVCRHRGMVLVEEPKRLRGMIRCPYHSWVYDLDGGLRATPHVGGPGRNVCEGIERGNLGLQEVASHVWHDVVFVNLDGAAPPFEEANAALIERWGDFEQPSHPGGADSRFDLHVACNWKLAVENYCESYHLPWIHPGLNAYSRLEDHYHIVAETFSGQGTTVYDPSLSQAKAFEDFENLGAEWDRQAEYVGLFPNVLLGVHRDHRYAIVLLPQGPERTIERVSISYARPQAPGDEHAEARTANTAQWRGIFEEDVFVVEGMQKGRHANAFDGGRFSAAMDEPTWAFHRWVASRFESPVEAPVETTV